MYKQLKDTFGNIRTNAISRVADGAYIPFDPANVDFQQYQVWLSEGNVPTPADEPTLP